MNKLSISVWRLFCFQMDFVISSLYERHNEKKTPTPEFEFFVQSDLSEYKGKYVAIIGRKVVASGKTAKEVWEKAKQQFPDKIPTLAKLPKEEALVCLIRKKRRFLRRRIDISKKHISP